MIPYHANLCKYMGFCCCSGGAFPCPFALYAHGWVRGGE